MVSKSHRKKWFQERWCREQGGQVEVVLPDKTRCDCVTDTHAIEYDFDSHRAEAVNREFFNDLTIQLINQLTETDDLPIDTWSVGNTSYSK